MTNRKRVFTAICEILRDDVHCQAPITPATDLLADAQLDSLDLLTLTVELENRFAIVLNDVEGPESIQVGHIVDRVLHHLEVAAAATAAGDGGHPDE